MSQRSNYPWLAHYPPNIPWDATITPRPLFTLLDESEEKYPRNPALDFLGRTYTYHELGGLVRRMASGLRKLGVRKGVKVGLFLPNCPQFVISYFAVLKAGGTVVNYNPLYSAREIHHQIEDSATEIMVTLALNNLYPKVAEQLGKSRLRTIIASGLEEALPLAKRMGFLLTKKKDIAEIPQDSHHVRFNDLLEEPELSSPAVIHPEDDIAVFQYTGGTTGVPKAAVLTHANLYCNTVQCNYWFTGLEYGRERFMGALPLFHVFAMTAVMNLGLFTGSMIILHPRFDLKAIVEDIQKKKPTLMMGVPTMFAAMNNMRNIGEYDLTSLKMCFSGGAPLPLEVKQAFETRCNCKLVEGYGLSETSPVTNANPLFGVNKAGSIGLPLPQTIIEITDIDDPDKLLPLGETGEICVRGPQVMRGYLHQLDETRRALRGGRLHTGDIGYIDSEGYVFIVDRLKEMIISGGYNIYPRNIEEVLYTHPDIIEAAVVGLPHPQRGQVPKAYVVKREGSTLDVPALKDFLRGRLTAYALPAQYEFRDSLPKSMIGKILKKELLAEEKAKG
jgi:long-chain acyl-CoA synthetase